MSTETFVVATRSAGKTRELRELFRRAGRTILTLEELGVPASAAEDDLENEDTFEGNALAKARYFAALVKRPVVADDSGLEVFVLQGRPGVHSKRWSGRVDLSGEALDQANNALLIETLSGIEDRRARYVCVAAFTDGVRELTVRGVAEGIILDRACGSNGFGYDPFFFSTDLGKTFAEASLEEKETVSHRARAFKRLLESLDGRG